MLSDTGINHIEIWVSSLERSEKFYASVLTMIGWKDIGGAAWSSGRSQIYLREEKATSRVLSLGVHHLCLQAIDKQQVDSVAKWLKSNKAVIFDGPRTRDDYSQDYYTVDFYDPDGFILEVAFTPNMEL